MTNTLTDTEIRFPLYSNRPDMARAEAQKALGGSGLTPDEIRAIVERAKARGTIEDADRKSPGNRWVK